MRRVSTILVAMSLTVFAVQFGWTEPAANPTVSDKSQAVKTAELKGDLARIHNNYEMAVGYYLSALHMDRQNPVLFNKLGIAELQLKQRNSARKHFQQALKYDPHYVSALNNLGAVAYLDKKYRASIGYLKQALALDETNASTHLNLAEAWMGLGDMDRAMTEYARALELNADILSSSEEGIQAQVTTPEQRARISYLIAKAYAKRGNLDGALEYLKRAKEQHFGEMARVYTDQEFTALWPDPRLAKIVKR